LSIVALVYIGIQGLTEISDNIKEGQDRIAESNEKLAESQIKIAQMLAGEETEQILENLGIEKREPPPVE
jgi:hypothetical protein